MRHTFATDLLGGRGRPAQRAGDAGACEPVHHAGLHAPLARARLKQVHAPAPTRAADRTGLSGPPPGGALLARRFQRRDRRLTVARNPSRPAPMSLTIGTRYHARLAARTPASKGHDYEQAEDENDGHGSGRRAGDDAVSARVRHRRRRLLERQRLAERGLEQQEQNGSEQQNTGSQGDVVYYGQVMGVNGDEITVVLVT